MGILFVRRGATVNRYIIAAGGQPVIDDADFIWLHLDGVNEDVDAQVRHYALLPHSALAALKAQETRPRCASFAEGALVNMRGLGQGGEQDGDPLVSIRIWAQKAVVVSLSLRPLGVFHTLEQQMMDGEFSDPGDMIAATAKAITDDLDPYIADLGDELDEYESRVLDEAQRGVRHRVAALRATAISYRRFLSPQRQAMEKLMLLQSDWLEPDDCIHLQEAADRCARMVEELEAVRERAALVHEALTDLRAEHMNRQGLILSIVALIFLPLTFITGLLGMNVAGIPLAGHPWAFWGVVVFCVMIGMLLGIWFKISHWLGK